MCKITLDLNETLVSVSKLPRNSRSRSRNVDNRKSRTRLLVSTRVVSSRNKRQQAIFLDVFVTTYFELKYVGVSSRSSPNFEFDKSRSRSRLGLVSVSKFRRLLLVFQKLESFNPPQRRRHRQTVYCLFLFVSLQFLPLDGVSFLQNKQTSITPVQHMLAYKTKTYLFMLTFRLPMASN